MYGQNLFILYLFYIMAAEKKVQATAGKDTWSPEAQIGRLTQDILLLQEHVAKNKKDYDAKRALLQKVAKRRRFLRYLKDNHLDRYAEISKKTGLKV
jgi:small subunit ribosomal protein S15